jgi:hypothetical protein
VLSEKLIFNRCFVSSRNIFILFYLFYGRVTGKLEEEKAGYEWRNQNGKGHRIIYKCIGG